MTTTYIHKRTSVATNQPASGTPNGELFVNLSSGKLRTTRSIIEGIFIGTVISATASSITLESEVPAFLALRTDVTTLRSTTSDTLNTSPAISTVTIPASPVITGQQIDYTSTSLKGDVFKPGDFVWAEIGNSVEETIVLSGQTTAGPISPPDALRGDVWIDTSVVGTPAVMIYDDSDTGFVLFEPDSGDTGGGIGSGAFEAADLSIQTQPGDSEVNNMDFGLINSLPASNTALDTTYSAVDYNFGGIRSPRPGPDFGVLT